MIEAELAQRARLEADGDEQDNLEGDGDADRGESIEYAVGSRTPPVHRGKEHDQQRVDEIALAVLLKQSDGEWNFWRGELGGVDRVYQCVGGLKSMQRIFLQQSIDRAGERCREISADAADRWNRFCELLDQNFLRGLTADREQPGHAVLGNQSERIENASSMNVVGGGLFGAHEFRRVNDFTNAREAGVAGRRCAADARNADVHDERSSGGAFDHDAVGLDVAMDDAATVRVRERVPHILQQANAFLHAEWPGAFDAFGQTLPFDVAHRHREQVATIFDGEDGHDVRMREAGGGARFAEKAFAQIALRGKFGRQYLDGDRSIKLHIYIRYIRYIRAAGNGSVR